MQLQNNLESRRQNVDIRLPMFVIRNGLIKNVDLNVTASEN